MSTMLPTTLSAHILRAVAVKAEVDPRTVQRLLRGERVLPLLEARIRRALASMELIPTHSLPTSRAERLEVVSGYVKRGLMTDAQAKKLLVAP